VQFKELEPPGPDDEPSRALAPTTLVRTPRSSQSGAVDRTPDPRHDSRPRLRLKKGTSLCPRSSVLLLALLEQHFGRLVDSLVTALMRRPRRIAAGDEQRNDG